MNKFLLSALAVVGLSASEHEGSELKKDLAQYDRSDYANAAQVDREISLDGAEEKLVPPLPTDTSVHKKNGRFGIVPDKVSG